MKTRLILDINKTQYAQLNSLVTGRVGDKASNTVDVYVVDGFIPYNLTGLKVFFECAKPDNTVVRDDNGVKMIDATKGHFEYTFPTETFGAMGKAKQAFMSIEKDKTIRATTQDFVLITLPDATTNRIPSESYFSDLEKLIQELNEMALEEINSQAAAEASAAKDFAEKANELSNSVQTQLNDIRVGADGKTYPTPADAIREFEKNSLYNENNITNAIGKIADSVPTSNTSTTGHDLSRLTATITNAKYWNNGFISEGSIYLTGIKVKTTATVVSVKIYKKENGIFTFVKDLGDLNVISGLVSVNYLLLKPNYSVFVQFKNGQYYYDTPVGFSSDEILNGIFAKSQVLASFNLVFSKAGVNFFDMSALNGKTEQLSSLLKDLSEFTPGDETFINNEVDLNSITLTVANTRYYSNGPMQNEGFLKGLYLKTNAQNVRIVAGKIDNNIFTLTHIYGDFSVGSLQNGYLPINDDKHYLSNDEHIFIKQTGGFYYFKNSTNNVGFQMESDFSGIRIPTGVDIGFNAVIAYGIPSSTLSYTEVKAIEDNMTIMQKDITNLQNDITKEVITKKYMPVFENDFSKENKALTILNDTTGNAAWSFDYANKYTYPTAKGGYYNDGTANLALQNILKLNKRYECDMKVLKFDVVLYSDTVLNIHMFRNQHTNEIPNESLYVIDIPNNKIRMTTLTGRKLIVGTYATEKNIGFNFVNGNKYQIEIEKKDYEFYFRIKDYVTGAITELKLLGWGAGSQLSYYGFSWAAGSVAPKLSKLSVHMPENPIVAFVGDSITEGYGMNSLSGNNSFTNRFAELARVTIGDCVISAASSGVIDDVIEKFESEFSIYKPKYLFVTIGTNGSVEMNSIANYTQIKNLCESNKIKLILNHIPSGGSNTTIYYKEKNANIDAVSEDGVKFDIATAINNDINSGGDNTLFTDGIHPNYNGSLKMSNRIKLDIPELFY